MQGKFDYFVIFAEMRTGSNFLEVNLNRFSALSCYGEAFNPHFIGYPKESEILGVTQAIRDADPERLIETIKKKTDGLGGFRFFHNHDPRALEICLDDPRCAKIILTRNPLDSYVSWKIAKATGQWKLTNVKRHKDSKISFDAVEFGQHVTQLQEFQLQLLNRMQCSGQTAYYLAYEDLQNIDVINGLARFLGCKETLDKLDASLKKQNPKPLDAKVSNFEEMEETLAQEDFFNISRTPNFEPRRGAAVPGYLTGASAPLLFMPIRSGPELEIRAWLADLDGVSEAELPSHLNQKSLRQWKRRMSQHRSFTVVRHPVARVHSAFCNKILAKDDPAFTEIRKTLRNFHNLPIPADLSDNNYDRRAHRAAFIAFLEFVRASLVGQTNLRIDANWASQSSLIQGMARFATPDMIIREGEMNILLPTLARQVGYHDTKVPDEAAPDQPVPLADIYDDEIESLVKSVYQRDYMMFGFGPWQ